MGANQSLVTPPSPTSNFFLPVGAHHSLVTVQVLVYYKLLDWFRPTYVLMEQVLDIQTKEDGIYVKTSIAEILRLGYQSRTGNLTSGAYGCPQVCNLYILGLLDPALSWIIFKLFGSSLFGVK